MPPTPKTKKAASSSSSNAPNPIVLAVAAAAFAIGGYSLISEKGSAASSTTAATGASSSPSSSAALPENFVPMPELGLESALSTKKGYKKYGETITALFRQKKIKKAKKNKSAEEEEENAEEPAPLTPAEIEAQKKMGGDLRYPRVFAKKPIKAQSEALLTVPRSGIIDMQTITESGVAKLLTYEEGKHLTTLGGRSFQQVFAYALYLMTERRKGKESTLYEWFNTLPDTFAHEGGALYWPEHIKECLDEMTASEVVAIQSIVGTIVQGAAACCALPEAVTKEVKACAAIAAGTAEPFSDAEARWAVAVYLRYNYNDQLIMPFMNLFRRSNDHEGIALQSTKDKSGTIEVLAMGNLQKNEEAVWNINRGAGSSLAIFGRFEPSSVATEIPFRIPDAKPKSLIYKACTEQRNNLVFLSNGKPKDQMIHCLGALMAKTKEQKKNFAAQIKARDPAFMVDIYGNLTVVVHRQLQSVANATRNEACTFEGVKRAQKGRIYNYLAQSSRKYQTITEYLLSETERLAKAAGLPPRLKVTRGGDKAQDIDSDQDASGLDDTANKEEGGNADNAAGDEN